MTYLEYVLQSWPAWSKQSASLLNGERRTMLMWELTDCCDNHLGLYESEALAEEARDYIIEDYPMEQGRSRLTVFDFEIKPKETDSPDQL